MDATAAPYFSLLHVAGGVCLLLFLPAFTARALYRLRPCALTATLAEHRCTFLVLLGLSHTVVLCLLLVMASDLGWPAIYGHYGPVKLAFLAFHTVLIYALSAYASVRLISDHVRALFPSVWMNRAMYAVWSLFAVVLVHRALDGNTKAAVAAFAAAVALVVRVAGRRPAYEHAWPARAAVAGSAQHDFRVK